MLRDEWKEKLFGAGAKESSGGVFNEGFFQKFEYIGVHWFNKNHFDSEDYIPIRNKIAREMRKDGWEVRSKSSPVMGKTHVSLEAERKI